MSVDELLHLCKQLFAPLKGGAALCDEKALVEQLNVECIEPVDAVDVAMATAHIVGIDAFESDAARWFGDAILEFAAQLMGHAALLGLIHRQDKVASEFGGEVPQDVLFVVDLIEVVSNEHTANLTRQESFANLLLLGGVDQADAGLARRVLHNVSMPRLAY